MSAVTPLRDEQLPEDPDPGTAEGVPFDREGDAVEKASRSTLFGRGLLYVVVAGLQLVTSAIASPILAHVLDDPAQLGTLSSAIALHQLLAAILLVGLDHAIVLRRARDGHDLTARSIATAAMLIVSALTVVVWLTSVWWAPAFGLTDRPIVLITVLWTVPTAGVMISLGLLNASDRLRAYTVLGAFCAVGGQAVGLTLVLTHPPFTTSSAAANFALGLLVADLVGVVLGFALTRPRLRGALTWSTVGPSLALGAPLALDSVSLFVLNAGDRILLQRLAGAGEVGRYQIAYTLGYTATMVIALMSSTWTPRFAAVGDRLKRWQLIGATRDSIYRLLTPVVLGIVLGAPLALRIVAPASFRPGSLLPVVYLVVLSSYAVAASSATGRMLVTGGRTRAFATCTLIAAVVNIGVNLVLIPWIGLFGAAIATIVAYLVQGVVQRAVVGGGPEFPATPRRVLAEIAVVVAVGGASLLLPRTDLLEGVEFALALGCLPWCVLRLRQVRSAG